MSWTSPSQNADDYINALQTDEKRLLQVLALAIRVEPQLIRNARLHYLPQSDTAMEMKIWFSDAMQQQNPTAAGLRHDIARRLLDEFQHQEGYQQAKQFIRQQTRHWTFKDRLSRDLRWAKFDNDETAGKQLLAQVMRTLTEATTNKQRRDNARWLKSNLPLMVDSLQPDERLDQLLHYSQVSLGSAGGLADPALVEPLNENLTRAIPRTKPTHLRFKLNRNTKYSVLQCIVVDDMESTEESSNQAASKYLVSDLTMPTKIQITLNKPRQVLNESIWPGRNIRIDNTQFDRLELQLLDGTRWLISVFEINPEVDLATSQAWVLAYSEQDRKQAEEISMRLNQLGFKIDPVSDLDLNELPHAESHQPNPQLIRLWSRAASDFWQKQSNTEPRFSGLILRLDQNIPLPDGQAQTRVLDVEQLDDSTMDHIRQWIEQTDTDTEPEFETQIKRLLNALLQIKTKKEISSLLQELEDAGTLPTRRLEIGDLLDEIGDPRPGVGVIEIELPEVEADKSPEQIRLDTLIAELKDPETEPQRRLEIGNELNDMQGGDPRFGVGLNTDGLPEIDWVPIPAGEFIYGEGSEQEKRFVNAFEIARYLVTNAQYQAFIDDGGYQDESWWDGLQKPDMQKSEWPQDNRPRTDVDWYEATAFTRWLSNRLNENIALPHEYQWERAARGTEGLVYPWGSEYHSGFANVDEKANKDGPYYLKQTSSVGVYLHARSPEGVMDLSGNVWEWCSNDYNQPDETTVVPSSPVLRGGSWLNFPLSARAANRFRPYPANRHLRGFRLLRSPPS